jgi:hypothetical protein
MLDQRRHHVVGDESPVRSECSVQILGDAIRTLMKNLLVLVRL